MSQSEPTVVPMGIDELLGRVTAVTDRTVAGIRQVMSSYEADLAELARERRYKALEASQPALVRAVIEAEMRRFAEEAERT